MILTEEQISDFQKASAPLIEWIAKNCHPHCHAYVDGERSELSEGLANVFLEERLSVDAALDGQINRKADASTSPCT